MTINTNTSASFNPIGLLIPFTNGSNGYFAQSFDTNTQVKQNLVNFLNTRRGERRMMPEFGTKLYEVLFEQIDTNTLEIVKNIVAAELQQWIPQITVQNISVNNKQNTGTNDNYKMGISVDYIVNQTKTQDNIAFDIQNVNI
jgi:phage baseplate assembly protein W